MTTASSIDAAKSKLADHPVYHRVRDERALRVFMRHHVVCVLDFMSLVKSLQRDLTSIGPVWIPPSDPEAARFLNEIVLDEESDAEFPGGPRSHFEWYLAAMDELGADTSEARDLVERLRAGEPPAVALAKCGAPRAAVEFGRSTFEALSQPLHVRAAVFFHGREDVIPRMFLPLVRELQDAGTNCALLRGYLERHIEADGDHHGPIAERLLVRLYGGDAERTREGVAAALEALAARERLWDAVLAALEAPAAV